MMRGSSEIHGAVFFMNNSKLIICLLCGFLLVSAKKVIGKDYWQTNAYDYCSILSFDETVSSIPMADYLKEHHREASFNSAVFLITFKSGLRAVFKPCSADDLKYAYGEVAAFKAARFLELDFVPPTVLRTIDGKFGSLQLYIETSLDSQDPKQFKWAIEHANPDDLANLHLFHFVFGQWDSGPSNLLIDYYDDESAQLIAIDNANICDLQQVRYGELPFVQCWASDTLKTDDWDEEFPFDHVNILQNPTPESVAALLGENAPETLCKVLSRRRNLHYIIYHNALWRQFYANDDTFIKAWTDYYPVKTIEQLKKLTIETITEIFADASGADFLTSEYYNAILERRDQVLAAAVIKEQN